MTVNWPRKHRELFESEARKMGISVNEYCIRVMAKAHGLLEDEPAPQDRREGPLSEPESGQLRLTG